MLWVRCGEGAYLSRLWDGKFDESQVLTWDGGTQAVKLMLTGNRALAVMQPLVQVEGDTDIVSADWQSRDFKLGRLQVVEGTGGTGCCGTLLQ